MKVIGIDPGTQTGFAVWDTVEKELKVVGSMLIHQAMKLVEQYQTFHSQEGVFVRVEDARQAVFGGQNAKDCNKAQGAGSVKRDCSILDDFLKDLGVDYQMVRPSKQLAKLPAETFQKLTGWKDRTNGHARDAAMLCWQFVPPFKKKVKQNETRAMERY